MNTKQYKNWNMILNLLAIILAFAGALLTSWYRWLCLGLALAVVVAGTALNYRARRCPHCGRVLTAQETNLQQCPYCHQAFSDSQES